MTTPRIGTRVRILSTGEELKLVARVVSPGKGMQYILRPAYGLDRLTGPDDIEAIPKQRRKA